MAYKFDIEKQHWRRYHIIQKKLYQYKQYGIGKTGKYKIGKYNLLNLSTFISILLKNLIKLLFYLI